MYSVNETVLYPPPIINTFQLCGKKGCFFCLEMVRINGPNIFETVTENDQLLYKKLFEKPSK